MFRGLFDDVLAVIESHNAVVVVSIRTAKVLAVVIWHQVIDS
jgi:hypothetical protein